VVFVPLPSCDPSTHDGGVEAGPADAKADVVDPCAGVTAQNVSFTAAECASFAAAEAAGSTVFDGGKRAPALTDPGDGAALSSDAWSIFAWNKGATASREEPRPLERVADWLEPSAHAYVPLNGDGYVLELTQGCTEVMRVMVPDTFWEPDPASWARLVATDGPVVVRVFQARFAGGAVVGAPLASAPITITMKK
jgi:hypothetical protein